MRLSIRYENQFQSIELNEEETQEMWVSLSLEGENLEKEKLIQKTFDDVNADFKTFKNTD